jgi:hypothetical protein
MQHVPTARLSVRRKRNRASTRAHGVTRGYRSYGLSFYPGGGTDSTPRLYDYALTNENTRLPGRAPAARASAGGSGMHRARSAEQRATRPGDDPRHSNYILLSLRKSQRENNRPHCALSLRAVRPRLAAPRLGPPLGPVVPTPLPHRVGSASPRRRMTQRSA